MTYLKWIKKDELTLGEYLMKVLATHGKDSDEFRGLVLIFGIDALREAYRQAMKDRSTPPKDGKTRATGEKD